MKSDTNLELNNKNAKIVKTDIDNKDGQDKCPKCGSTDISTNIKTGKLRCNFCRHEFDPQKISGMEESIDKLKGKTIASGAKDIIKGNDVITLKCSSCGAEVVIDTSSVTQARCHWCRNVLSINNQLPNGSIPDVVLPFGIEKDVAQTEIEKFVGKRKFFAHPKFKKEFTTNNIMGVYFPYMIIDVNMHSNLSGEGEIETRRYTEGDDEHKVTYYDADVYHVEREFDITIDGLSIESNSNRLNNNSKSETNNIINSIMPFDVENCVKYNSNYLNGYTSERRDTNISDLKDIVHLQAEDIARFAANDSLDQYDRGVRWDNENHEIKGEQWKSAYLPVWLYSYQQIKGSKKLLHYVAVNARTKETMGSVPIHMPKLLFISAIIEALSFYTMYEMEWDNDYILLSLGVIFFLVIYFRYRNSNARHTYEKDTKTNLTNLKKEDVFLESKKRLTNSSITGRNNNQLKGSNVSDDFLKKISNNSKIADVIKITNNLNKK